MFMTSQRHVPMLCSLKPDESLSISASLFTKTQSNSTSENEQQVKHINKWDS